MRITQRNSLINTIQELIDSEGEAKINELDIQAVFKCSPDPQAEFAELLHLNGYKIKKRPAYAYYIIVKN